MHLCASIVREIIPSSAASPVHGTGVPNIVGVAIVPRSKRSEKCQTPRAPRPNSVTKTTSASRPSKLKVKEARSGQDLQTAVNQSAGLRDEAISLAADAVMAVPWLAKVGVFEKAKNFCGAREARGGLTVVAAVKKKIRALLV